jgi:IS5 family transposase
MTQMGFFDVEKRYAALDAKHDPLVKINAVVPWEAFRSRLEKAWRKPADKRKSNAGCKAWDAIVMFKAIVLCALCNLSDDQVEYQMCDRLSFVRFLGLALEDKVPDAKTVWLYREQLSQAGVIDALFDDFDGYLKTQGYQAMGGQIIDASIVAVPKQRNNRAENAQIKQGETPKDWADKAARRRQKDTDARWTKKHGKSHYGYKNHLNIDRRHKLIRHYSVTDASVHDSQAVDDLLTSDNTASGVWADSAWRSKDIEEKIKEKGLTSRIHRKACRNRPLRDWEKAGNRSRSRFRVRAEHVFGAQHNDMGGTLVRSIGLVRATARIRLENLAYNMRRLVGLQRLGMVG